MEQIQVRFRDSKQQHRYPLHLTTARFTPGSFRFAELSSSVVGAPTVSAREWEKMAFERASGILLHPTSLPSRGGIGDFGPEAYKFVEWLATAKQRLWQVLPLNPTGFGNSPYSATSAFAGNPLLISLEVLAEQGWIGKSRLHRLPEVHRRVDFGAAYKVKLPLLREAATKLSQRRPKQR